eukprot:jgi/Botrbrau1/21061/Bobra.0144s0060.1
MAHPWAGYQETGNARVFFWAGIMGLLGGAWYMYSQGTTVANEKGVSNKEPWQKYTAPGTDAHGTKD